MPAAPATPSACVPPSSSPGPSSPGPFVVGLTGGIGSGKTTVADRFGALGATLVDSDLITHELTGPQGAAMPRLVEAFGPDIAEADGRMNRARMRELVFNDPAARKRLESIVHPMVRELSERRIRQASGPYVISVVPLLVESGNGWQRWADRVLVVDVPEAVQVERVMRRNGFPREQVLAIMRAQASREQRLAVAHDVVDNSGEPAGLDRRVSELHQRYLALAREKAALQPAGPGN